MSSNNQSSMGTAVTSTTATIAPITASTLAPVGDFVWNYAASTVGGQSTLPPIWWFTTVILLGLILYCYRFRPGTLFLSSAKGGLSTPMLVLFINHFVNNAMFILSTYIVNKFVTYNPLAFNSSNWLNTWWSFWVGNYLMAAPCTVLLATLDRFLALKLAYRYSKKRQRRFGYLTIIFLLAIYAFSLANVLIAWPYDKACIEPGTEDNPIANRPCLPLLNKIVNYMQQALNVGLSLANILIGITIVLALRAIKIQNVKDRIVRITIICELIFHALPAIVQLGFSISELNVNLNVYTFLFASLDAFVCSVVYTKLMVKFFNKKDMYPSSTNAGPNQIGAAHSQNSMAPSIQMKIIHTQTAVSVIPAGTIRSQSSR